MSLREIKTYSWSVLQGGMDHYFLWTPLQGLNFTLNGSEIEYSCAFQLDSHAVHLQMAFNVCGVLKTLILILRETCLQSLALV